MRRFTRAFVVATLRLACIVGISACAKSQRSEQPVEAAAQAVEPASSEPPPPPPFEAREVIRETCLSCHSEHILAQQRLHENEWSKVVRKMKAWGATFNSAHVDPLIEHLGATYPAESDTGGGVAYEPTKITAAEARAELAPTDDAPFPAGDAERGEALYAEKCASCHGPDARGKIGTTLVDRPFLYRAADFARTVRRGRGAMLPIPLSDAEIADVLAHLRRLENPLP